MIKIYHNNRCSKSRCGIELLENSGKEFEVVKYLDDLLSKEELEKLAQEAEKVIKFIEGKQIVKIIVIPARLVNIVIK